MCLIEWPDRLGTRYPQVCLDVHIRELPAPLARDTGDSCGELTSNSSKDESLNRRLRQARLAAVTEDLCPRLFSIIIRTPLPPVEDDLVVDLENNEAGNISLNSFRERWSRALTLAPVTSTLETSHAQ